MTPEEVERHLQSRQNFMELVPERAPPTVPTEMFSNEPSLDRYVVFFLNLQNTYKDMLCWKAYKANQFKSQKGLLII